jgi:hypothetical protein
MRAALALSLLAFGCTVENPNYAGAGGGGGIGGGGGQPGVDGGGQPQPPDLSQGTDAGNLPSPDLAPPACNDGERSCVDSPAVASQVCAQGQLSTSRVCPAGIVQNSSGPTCMNGYCQPPDNGLDCAQMGGPSDDPCFNNLGVEFTCQPFVDAQAQGASWFCAGAVGMGASGAPCQNDNECRSGFCGSNGTCFRACSFAQDCPQQQGPPLRCKPVTIEVEGIQVTATSCIP